MTLETITGDLFAQRDLDALGQGTNLRGQMGAGIAVEFKRRFPDMFTDYAAACANGTLTLGGVWPYRLPNGRWIYSLGTQIRPGRDARLDAIESAVTAMLAHATEHGVASVGLPRLGSGYGGLPWASVQAVIADVAEPSGVVVRVVSLPGAHG